MAAPLRILYFAWLRQRIGCGEEVLEAPSEVGDVGQLMRWLAGRGGGYAAAFADPTQVRAAVNQDFAGLTHRVQPGDEVAFFPPVTGG